MVYLSDKQLHLAPLDALKVSQSDNPIITNENNAIKKIFLVVFTFLKNAKLAVLVPLISHWKVILSNCEFFWCYVIGLRTNAENMNKKL